MRSLGRVGGGYAEVKVPVGRHGEVTCRTGVENLQVICTVMLPEALGKDELI